MFELENGITFTFFDYLKTSLFYMNFISYDQYLKVI